MVEFFVEAAGGIAIGLVVGWVIAEVRRRVNDTNTELTISLFSAYGAFIPADQLGVSGVLAAVTCGVYLGFRAPEIASPESRMQGYGLWSILTFLLNAALFILIGLQLPVIIDGLAGTPAGEVAGYAAAVCAAVIARPLPVELVITTLIRALDRRAVAARAAGRGAPGSSAAGRACAAPSRWPRRCRCRWQTDAGAPLPGRELIQFITFALILVTVVGQGLTLPWLIRRLGVVEDGPRRSSEELRARLVIARAALDRVEELEAEDWTRDGTSSGSAGCTSSASGASRCGPASSRTTTGSRRARMRYQRMMHEIYGAQREALVRLRNSREISGEVMRRVERELDLEESRLEV